jgi:predicted transcriptional regulator
MIALATKMKGVHKMQSTMGNIKQAAHALIDLLPENASWDDVMYELMVRKEIELGMADSEAGRVTSVGDVRKEFGLE